MQAVAELEADCEHLQGLVRQREDERDRQRTQVDELSQQLSDLEARHRQDNEAKRQALEDRDDSESELRRARSAKNDAEGLLRDIERDVERWKRQVNEKEEVSRGFWTRCDWLPDLIVLQQGQCSSFQ